MSKVETQLTNFVHHRAAVFVTLIAVFAAGTAAWLCGLTFPLIRGLNLLPAPVDWCPPGPQSLAVSLAVTMTVGFGMLWVNRRYNILRSLTDMGTTMFFVMQCAMPGLLTCFYGGSLLVITVLVCSALLFAVYASAEGQRSVFLLFMLLAAASFCQVTFLLFIPVFLVGLVQMRIFRLRTVLAALLGVITPPWIIFGLGIVPVWDLQWPVIQPVWEMEAPTSALTVQAIVILSTTFVLGLGFMMANVFSLLSYNARVRSLNGFINLLWIATAAFTVLNFTDWPFYVGLLNLLTAFQVAHFFSSRRSRRTWLPVFVIAAIYFAFCFWSFA